MKRIMVCFFVVAYSFCASAMQLQQSRYNQKATLALQEKINKTHDFNKITAEEIIALIITGADPNVKGKFSHGRGQTILQIFIHQTRTDDVATVAFLLKHGADPSINDLDGNSPLQDAISEYKLQIAKYLIEHGANIHNTDKYGRTVLNTATSYNRIEMVKLLLENGAFTDIEKASRLNESPLSIARRERCPEILELFELYKKRYVKRKLR